MSDELTRSAITERDIIRAEITWSKAGAKLVSLSHDDITATTLTKL